MNPADAALIDAFEQAQRRRHFSDKTIICRTSVLAKLARHGPGLAKGDEEGCGGAPRLPAARTPGPLHLHVAPSRLLPVGAA